MMWMPLSEEMGSESCPTSSAKEASSNCFCIAPRPKKPRSPPRLAELQCDSCSARTAKSTSPATIRSRKPSTIATASSWVRVTTFSFHELGRRESLCLTSRCEHLTCSIPSTRSRVRCFFDGYSGLDSAARFGGAGPERSSVYSQVYSPKRTVPPGLSESGLCFSSRTPSTKVPLVAPKSITYTFPFEWWTSAAWTLETEAWSSVSWQCSALRPTT
mmetsp:Transcript_18679/g.60949  ORF Transcript_18679/g.60949 Transcript_18679/m.60949 type:complete len:216 (+) Transcript_18679:685-1332(+)